MSEIRALEVRDIEQVAALYERVVRSGANEASPGLVDYFRRTLLDHPMSDPDIPSLVSEDDAGRIVGFIGSHPRQARLGEQQIRIGCSGQLVSDPVHGNPAVGALLMRQYLAGPQDLTITDGATPLVSEMWTRHGRSAWRAGLHPPEPDEGRGSTRTRRGGRGTRRAGSTSRIRVVWRHR